MATINVQLVHRFRWHLLALSVVFQLKVQLQHGSEKKASGCIARCYVGEAVVGLAVWNVDLMKMMIATGSCFL